MKVLIKDKQYEGKEFYNRNIAQALEDSQSNGYIPLFMPKLIDQRTQNPKSKLLWNNWFIAPSLRATGQTSQGSKVVVYVHKENHFSNLNNVRTATIHLINGAGIIPQEEFQKYINEDGKEEEGIRLVSVIPY